MRESAPSRESSWPAREAPPSGGSLIQLNEAQVSLVVICALLIVYALGRMAGFWW